MTFITPKTNWKNGDYFNLDPDYVRIKNNIEFLTEMSYTIYAEYPQVQLETVSLGHFPKKSFFNNVVKATNNLLEYCYDPLGQGKNLQVYKDNGIAWSAEQLNRIETQHLELYNAFLRQKTCLNKLELTLGGVHLGNKAIR